MVTALINADYQVTPIPHIPIAKPELVSDIVICCHAAPITSRVEDVIKIDVIGTLLTVIPILPIMSQKNFGRVVLFSSIRAHHPRPGQVAYATAKSAIEGMTRALAVEYGPYGITINCIAPGAVDTPRTRANIAAGIVSEEELVERTPNGRLATVDDVCSTVLWLVSDGAAHVNGQVITVDGGWSVNG
jgi:2-hydroxycyclohexanecarboxyl-CoA dehydrogenase